MPRLYNFDTNSYEEIPDEHVRDKILSRRYAFSDTEKVGFAAPDGSTHLIPGAKALEALSHGGRFLGGKELDRRDRVDKYGEGWENYLGAALAGGARGATLGASDVPLRAILGKERMRTWREELSGVSTAAEIGAAILPTIATGGGAGAVTGARLAARGAKASAFLPSSVAFKWGQGFEQALSKSAMLSRGADKGLALKVVSSALPKAVGGAFEGAALGAGTSLTESVLGDPDESSEMLLANIGYSALFGGLANAGIHATLLGGAGAARKMSDGFASIYEKATNSKLSVAGQKKLADLTGGLLGAESKTIQKQVGLWADPKKGRADALAKEGTFKQSQDDIVTGLNDTLDDLSAVAMNSRGSKKQEAMRKHLFVTTDEAAEGALARGENFVEGRESQAHMAHRAIAKSRDVVADIYEDLRSLVDASEQLGGYSWIGGSKNLGEHAEALHNILSRPGTDRTKAMSALESILRKWDAPKVGPRPQTHEAMVGEFIKAGQDTFLLLDDYKKFLAHFAFGKKARSQLDFNTQSRLRDTWSRVHELLEDKSLWGKAAEVQKTVNPKFSRLIKAEALFRKAFRDPVSNELVNTKKIGQYLKNLEGRGDDTMEASWGVEREAVFDDFLNAAEDFASSSSHLYGFAGDAATSASRAVSNAKKTRDKVKSTVTDMRETRFINEAAGGKGFDPKHAAALYRRFGSAVLGGLTLGPAGAAAGLIMGGLADGASTARKLAMMEQAIGRGRKALNDSLDKTIDRMAKGGPGGSIPVRPNRTKLFLAPLADQFGESTAKEKRKASKLDQYNTAKKRAMQMTDPELLMSSIGKITEPIEHDMPMLSAAIKGKLASGMGNATEGFNKDNRTIEDKIMGVPERQPTDREMAQTEIRCAVLEDPIGETLGNLQAGTLTATHVDMLERCYPTIYQNISIGLMDRMSVFAEEGGKTVPYGYKAQLSILFKRPFDSSFKTENINILQASYGEKDPEGGKIKSSPLIKHPGMGPTEVERIATG